MPQTSMRTESQSVMLLFNDKNENHIHVLTTSVTDKQNDRRTDQIMITYIVIRNSAVLHGNK